MDLSKLSAFIQGKWFLTHIHLHLLQNKGGRFVYRINAKQGVYVFKLSNSAKTYEDMMRDLYIFDSDQNHGFSNIPMLLKAKDNSTMVAYEDKFGFIMEYIDGGTPADIKENWDKIGLLTAQLHKIKDCKYKTNLTPESEKAWIQAQAQKWSFGKVYKQLFDGLTDFSAFPQTFIHTDIGLHNCAKNKKGELFFLDWDGAGIGWRILDIGFPLISQFVRGNNIQEENIQSFYKTYFEHTNIQVSRKEKEAIFDASLFFSLIYVPYGDVYKNWAKVQFAMKHKEHLLSLILAL